MASKASLPCNAVVIGYLQLYFNRSVTRVYFIKLIILAIAFNIAFYIINFTLIIFYTLCREYFAFSVEFIFIGSFYNFRNINCVIIQY